MFKGKDIEKWFKGFDKAFNSFDKSIDKAGKTLESHLTQRTDSLTPTLSHALKKSRRFEKVKTKTEFSLTVSYNSDGSAPYAIEQHNMPYSHAYEHNPTEVQSYTGGAPLLYLYTPLVKEKDAWAKMVFSKVGWK